MGSANKAKHVLVGDHEEHTRLTLSLVLRKAGFKVTAAGHGNDVLNLILEMADGPDPLDLLLVDLGMPGLTGLELVGELKRREIPLPVFLMCGYLDKESVADAMRSGCEGYLEKPFGPEELLGRINSIFEATKRRGDKEMGMAASNEYHGLCLTCNHEPDCAHPASARSPVLHCEEFDGYQAPPARSRPPQTVEADVGEAGEGSRHIGLCVNCDLHETCINATTEEGIWHCESYQ